MGKLTKNTVPAEPFAGWLNHRYAEIARSGAPDAAISLCREVGWIKDEAEKTQAETAKRRLYRFRHMNGETYVGRTDQRRHELGSRGKRKAIKIDAFPRDIVEEALHCAGVHLGELYPYEALVDEMMMEYIVPRDQAARLADAWIDRVWQTTWERVGLYVVPSDRPRAYCRGCSKTTSVFMGVCEECCAPVESVLVAA